MRVIILAGALLAAGFAGLVPAGLAPIGPAHAQGMVQVPADAIIAGRQAAYSLMGANYGDMKRAVDAKVTEVKPFKNNADAIAKWAKAVPGMFPAGTEQGNNTKALPVVWSDRAGFEKAAADLRSAAEELSKAADANDPAAFATAFADTGKACGACHRTYRAK